ncbi:S-adenosyl-L-methionine-dependent methyltransferase [Thelonectria olida]|uniref:S-adenosyl-L-methionine-dependent methyltransferase n=1 Tax=Thelonectria olida TaxID=1576542 RepID=A0A9P9ANH5_9HYPO|nr:S-adenosyl-L-methionine-dependent methyltransferase [Thelonectria olida]
MATIDADPVIVPDIDAFDDGDSSLGEDSASSTQSVSSSILDYRRENGRTYHKYKDGKYNLPNDEQENDRLDLQHHLFLLTFDNKLGLAPPNDPGAKPARVLDVGTGTGVWAVDYGDEHAGAKVIGVDLSPIQPDFVPPNVEFFVDDVEEPWTYSEPFDYVHSRMMTSSIASWPNYIRDVFANLAPGGYFEMQEIDLMLKSDDGTLTETHALSKWLQLVGKAMINLGRPFQDIKSLQAIMTEAGFVDVVVTSFKWPTNPWPRDKKYKELGAWNNQNLAIGVEGVTMAPLTRGLGWTQSEVNVFLTEVRKELNNRAIHAYWPIYSIYGRKPEVNSDSNE